MLSTDPNSPESIGALLLGIGLLALTADKVVSLVRNISGRRESTHISPSPLQVEAAPDFVRRDDFERMAGEVRELQGQIAGVEQRLRDETKQDTGELHEKINTLSREVSEMRGEQRSTNVNLISIGAKLDRFIERNPKTT